jgi:hypothetical protein
MLVTSHGSRPSTRGVMTSAPLSANPRFGAAKGVTTRDNGWMTNATPRDWLKGKGWRADGLSASAVAARNTVARAGMPASGSSGDGGDGRRGGDMRPNTAPATAAKAALYSSMRGALSLQQSGGGGGGGHEQSSGRRRRRVRRHRDGTTSVVVASSGGGGGGGGGSGVARAAGGVPSPVSVGTTEAFIPPAFASLQRPKTRHDAALRTTALDGRSSSGEGLGGERAGQQQGLQQGQGQGQGFVAARAPPVRQRQRQRQRAPVTTARQPAVPSSSSSSDGSDGGSDSERENGASRRNDASGGGGSRRGPRYLLQSAQTRFRRVRQQLQLSAAAAGTARAVLATGDI